MDESVLSTWDVLHETATSIFGQLEKSPTRFVFAESCTCGMIASAMGGVAGISQFFCGSLVTYREASKSAWLGVQQETLKNWSPESQETTEEMALRALQATLEAEWSLAITGHLGPLPAVKPNSPSPDQEKCFVSIANRGKSKIHLVETQIFDLVGRSRLDRQIEAANLALICFRKTVFGK